MFVTCSRPRAQVQDLAQSILKSPFPRVENLCSLAIQARSACAASAAGVLGGLACTEPGFNYTS